MRARAAIVVAVSFVVACGGRTPLELGGGSGDDDGGGPPNVDGSASDSGPDSGKPPNNPAHVGYVGAITTGGEGAFAVARFYPEVVDPACAYVGAVGACTVVTCFTGSDAPLSDDAGLIKANASSNGGDALLVYAGVSPTGTYPTATFSDGTGVDEGESIEFDGGGSVDVPSFGVDVTMPGFGTLTSPVIQVSTTIDTSVDLPLAWEPIAFGDAVFTLAPPASSTAEPTLICFFDGAAGGGVVPHALLTEIKAASPGGEADASFLAMARASTTAGDWTVNAIAVTGTGTSQQSGTVTLE